MGAMVGPLLTTTTGIWPGAISGSCPEGPDGSCTAPAALGGHICAAGRMEACAAIGAISSIDVWGWAIRCCTGEWPENLEVRAAM